MNTGSPISRAGKGPPEGGQGTEPQPGVIVASWRESDLMGLPRTEPTLAKRWRTTRASVLATMLGYLMIQSVVTVARLEPRLVPVPVLLWVVAVWRVAVRERRHKRVLEDCAQIGSPDDPLVSIRLQIDGYDYGHDVGRFDVTQACLFFDGGQISFTLLPGDFAIEKTEGESHTLCLHETHDRISILITPVSAKKGQLDALFASVKGALRSPGVATVLPPLEPGPDRLATVPGAYFSLGMGGCSAVGFVFIGYLWMIGTSNYQTFGAWAIASSLFGLAAVAGHRIWIVRDRARAIRDLPRLRKAIAWKAEQGNTA